MNRIAVSLSLLALAAPLAFGQARFTEKPDYSRTVRELPDALQRSGFEQKLNNPLPLDTVLRDEQGNEVTFGSLFNDRPVILTFVYYNCPMLCTIVLNSLTDTLKDISAYQPGRDYQIITISFDHTEGHELAAAKRAAYVQHLGLTPEQKDGWRFLTGSEESVLALTEAAGFTFAWDEARNDYAHASGIMLVTPDGRLSHYFFGVVFDPRDVRLGLVDASAGRIGTAVDRVFMLFCYNYDPAMGAYSFAIFRVLKLGGLLTMLGLALFIGLSLRSEKRAGQPPANPSLQRA
ncbi:MAG TPA: SCO family protein [Kiritimatiellia bacterium]|nr:SCO family protein [Kiritimatiellia bacterium]